MKEHRAVWLAVAILMLFALACNMPGGKATPETEAEVIPVAPVVTATMTVAPVAPAAELPSPTPTEAPDVAGEGGCVLRAAYVADVTIPDNTKVDKGKAFVKTWRIRNSGTCTWGEGTKFAYVSGETLGAPASIDMPSTAPDAEVDISLSMTAPTEPGTYRSNWQLQDPSGKAYGGIFYVQIVVEGPTPTSTPSAPSNFVGAVAADCTSISFTWTGATGETAYRIEGPSLLVNLPAGTTTYVWNNPPAGSSVVTLIAVGQNNAEIGRVSATVNVACGVSGVDLYVESITFEPSPPVAHLPLKVTVRVRNQGMVDSGSFVVRWWGGKDFSSVSCEWNVTGVTAGSTAALGCDNFRYSSPYGSIVTKAQVDVEGTVTESDETNNILENTISVANPKVVYDFVDKAPLASWQSGDPVTGLTWNGTTGDTQGFARWDSGTMETGAAIQGQCLETHPKWVASGWIAGTFIDLYNTEHYVVQAGDRFYATVGLLQGAGAGNVTFKVLLRASTSGTVTLAQVVDTYGDGLKTISVDLSPYAGQGADMILRVEAGDNADQDWACWLRAVIYRYP